MHYGLRNRPLKLYAEHPGAVCTRVQKSFLLVRDQIESIEPHPGACITMMVVPFKPPWTPGELVSHACMHVTKFWCINLIAAPPMLAA